MPAGLETLRDYRIATGIFRFFCKLAAAYYMHNRDPIFF